MSKYKFYTNRRTKNHPSLEVKSNEKSWENMELTSSPTKNGRYIKLKKNPDIDRSEKAYLRKYIRNDPIRTRGDLLRKYDLSEEDLLEIESYLLAHYENKKR